MAAKGISVGSAINEIPTIFVALSSLSVELMTRKKYIAVSYTHLTLPTIYSV